MGRTRASGSVLDQWGGEQGDVLEGAAAQERDSCFKQPPVPLQKVKGLQAQREPQRGEEVLKFCREQKDDRLADGNPAESLGLPIPWSNDEA